MSHTPTPWKTYYATRPISTIDGWSIKRDSDIQEPIGILPEPIGGIKNKHGRSTSQQANAELIIQAVNSHQAMKEALERIANSIVFVMDAKPLKKFAPAFQAIIDETEKALLLANGGTSE